MHPLSRSLLPWILLTSAGAAGISPASAPGAAGGSGTPRSSRLQVSAAPEPVAKQHRPEQSSIRRMEECYWYDGARRRTIWMDPDASIPFAANGVTDAVGTRRSPLFHASAGAGADDPGMALPGNVIAMLDPLWTREEVDRWASRNALVLLRPVSGMPNTYIIESEAGLASLLLANRLHESGEGVRCSPNWWRAALAR